MLALFEFVGTNQTEPHKGTQGRARRSLTDRVAVNQARAGQSKARYLIGGWRGPWEVVRLHPPQIHGPGT